MLGRMRTAYLSRTPLSAAVMLADEPNMEERQPGSWKCCVMRHRASRGASCAANNAVRPRRRCRAQTAAAYRCHGSGGRRGLLAAEDLCAPLSYLFPTVCPPGCRPPSRPPRARDYGRVPRRTMFPLAREALREHEQSDAAPQTHPRTWCLLERTGHGTPERRASGLPWPPPCKG